MIEVTNRLTAEVRTYADATPEEVILSIDEVQAEIDMLKTAKSRLQARATEFWRQRMQEAQRND